MTRKTKTCRRAQVNRLRQQIRVLLLLSLVLILLLYPVLLPQVEATAWWNNSWKYRRDITLTYGSNLVNAQVLMNTTIPATAYAAGKMRSDCGDLRFVDDSNNVLTFFTEVCNITAGGPSLIWVTASVTAPSTTIWMYYGNPSATTASQSWGGNLILMFQTLPSGWTRVTALDNRFPYGSATYGTTGGSSLHAHSSGSATMGYANGGKAGVGGGSTAVYAHTHPIPTITISPVNIWPPYHTEIFGSFATFSYDMPSGSILMMNGTIPTGWSQFADLTSKFPLGAATSTTAFAGNTTHTHPISSAAFSDSVAGMASITGSGGASVGHGHDAGSGTTDAADAGLPAHLNVLFAQSSSSRPLLAGMVVMFSVLPPQGWTRVTTLDNAFPYGAGSFSASVVAAATHTHTYSFYTGGANGGQYSAFNPGTAIAVAGHAHLITGTSGNNDVAWIPPYMTVIFAQRKPSLPTVTFGDEILEFIVSFQIVGGGAGYSAPIFHYVFGGVSYNYTLTTTPTILLIDDGSAWSVTPNPLTGSGASEQWKSANALSGTASATTLVFTFYHQYLQTLSYGISGGGTGYSAPSYAAYRYGSTVTQTLTTSPTGYWYDDGAYWSVANLLPGSNSSVRWYCSGTVSGTIASDATYALTFQLQYYLTMQIYPSGSSPGTTTPTSTWENPGASVPINAAPNSGWVWGQWVGSGSGSYSGASQISSVTVNGPITQEAQFTQQVTQTQTVTSTSVATTSTTITTQTTNTYTNFTTNTITNTFATGGPPPPPAATVSLSMSSWVGVVNQTHSEPHELMISESGATSVIITDVKFLGDSNFNSKPWVTLNDSLSSKCGCYMIIGPGAPVPLHFIVAPGLDVPANNYYSIDVELIGRASTGQQLTYQSLAIGVTVYSPYGAPAPVAVQQPILTPTTIAGAAVLAIITGAIGVAFRKISLFRQLPVTLL